MSRAQHLVPIGSLAFANMVASAAGLAVFVVAARSLDLDDLGKVGVLLAAAQFVGAVADGGINNLLMREVAAADSVGMTWWAVKRRICVSAIISPPVLLVLPIDATLTAYIASALLASGATVYTAVISSYQGLSRTHVATAMQLGRGLTATALAYIVSLDPTVEGFIWSLAASYWFLVGISVKLIVEGSRRPVVPPGKPIELRFGLIAAANGLTASVDSFLLGQKSAAAVGLYSAAQRPALAYAAINNALTAVLIPRFRSDRHVVPRAVPVTVSYVLVLLASALLGFLMTPFITMLLVDVTLSPWLTAVVFAAFGGDLVAAVVGASLLVVHRESTLAALAVVQMIATVAAVAALVQFGVSGVAVGVLIGRLAGMVVIALALTGIHQRSGSSNRSLRGLEC